MKQLRALTAGMALATGLLWTAGCTGDPAPHPTATFRDNAVPADALRLVAFTSCDNALDRIKQAAKAYVGPYGFGGWGVVEDAGGAVAQPRAVAPNAAGAPAAADKGAAPQAAAGAGSAEAPSYSGTNTHESGVDEPDLVKTDGKRIVTVGRGVLRVVDPATRKLTGKLDLGSSAEDPVRFSAADLLLSGDHALVLVSAGNTVYARSGGIVEDSKVRPVAPPSETNAVAGPRLLLVDLSGSPRLLSSYTMDGSLVDARQVGGTARVVVRSAPRLDFPSSDRQTDAQRLAANKAVIDKAGADDWLPRYSVDTGGRTTTGRVGCEAVHRPAAYTGTSMVTVLSFDLDGKALGDGAPVTVMADGDTVYSNGPSLYVVNDQRWLATPRAGGAAGTNPAQQLTEIYKFDTSGQGRPRYAAAGSVPGWLVNQYALSEWDGHLRVATTTDQSWNTNSRSESAVYVLAEDGQRLVQTGKVGGLGKGERIYSVRFIGPVGYVVTFRQTDPLYTVDLKDPAAPKVAGELKITGYSAYLHPAGDGRLIGIGQEASEQGRTQGTQVSLFDVSDLSRPNRLAQYHVPGGHSEAEFDPHAFLYWPADQLLVVPLTVYPVVSPGNVQPGTAPGTVTKAKPVAPSGEALLLRMGQGGISELGSVTHPAVSSTSDQIRRSLVVNGVLWTVSDGGLQATSLSTMGELGWVALN